MTKIMLKKGVNPSILPRRCSGSPEINFKNYNVAHKQAGYSKIISGGSSCWILVLSGNIRVFQVESPPLPLRNARWTGQLNPLRFTQLRSKGAHSFRALADTSPSQPGRESEGESATPRLHRERERGRGSERGRGGGSSSASSDLPSLRTADSF